MWRVHSMKYAKVIILLVLMLFFSISMVSASTIVVNAVNKSANHIFFDETAYYQLTIENTGETDQTFTWNVNPVEWVIDTKASMKVPAGQKEETVVHIRPRPSNYRGPGFYVVPFTVRSSPEGMTYEKQITIYIKSLDDRIFAYTPSVALGASIDEEVDPRQPVSVQVQIRNRNILEIEDMLLIINGETFDTTKTLPLAGLEEKTLEYRFDVDPLLEPDTYELHVRLFYENKTISEVKQFYDIKAYTSVDRDKAESTRFFKKTSISTINNDGNIVKVVTTDLDIKWYKWPFTRTDIEAQNMERIDRNSWKLTLQPDEVATITIIENYRILPLLALIAIIIIVLYFMMRSPLVLRKQTIITGKDEEGISEMKVRVFIKNRTGKAYFNVRVLDRAPSIASVKVQKGLGVLEPSKVITTEKKGTIIKWDFDSLEAYEERIVTYAIKAKLKIIGHLGLPPVKVKFENVNGKQLTTQSRRAIIGSK